MRFFLFLPCIALFCSSCGKSKMQPSPDALYAQWMQDFQSGILDANTVQTEQGDFCFGYELWQIKEVKLLGGYQMLVNAKGAAHDELILRKMQATDPGREFLAFAYCERKGWSPDALLAENDSEGNSYALVAGVLKKAGIK